MPLTDEQKKSIREDFLPMLRRKCEGECAELLKTCEEELNALREDHVAKAEAWNADTGSTAKKTAAKEAYRLVKAKEQEVQEIAQRLQAAGTAEQLFDTLLDHVDTMMDDTKREKFVKDEKLADLKRQKSALEETVVRVDKDIAELEAPKKAKPAAPRP